MNKEELIALSDLNREDNIKYISSEAQGIAIALNSDKYAPTLCKLERAYICGRRKSEEQIEQLEKENAELIGKVAFLENDLNNVKAQFEKLLDFAAERTEMCDVCPQTDNCINSEGTCPYAALDEEKATRKWIERYIKGAKHQNCKYYHGDVVTAFENKDYDNPCLTCFKFDNWEAAE